MYRPCAQPCIHGIWPTPGSRAATLDIGPEQLWAAPGLQHRQIPYYTGVVRTVHIRVWAQAPVPVRYRDPRTALDTVANPRTNQWFVSAGGRMRAAAGAHYACACVYRRPHARGRYEGHEVGSLPLPLSHPMGISSGEPSWPGPVCT